MKTLHLYLLRQVLATLVMTVFVFTFVLLLANVLKDMMDVIISRQASLGMILRMILLIIPWVLSFSLPMGMLTAALLVCGRFSADQELVAVRASGVSLISLVTPILLLGVAMSGLCFWINCDLAPRSRVAFKELGSKALAEAAHDLRSLRAGQYTTFDKYTIYAAKVNGTNLENVMIYLNDDQGNLGRIYSGSKGTMTFSNRGTNNEILVHLEDAYSTYRNSDGWFPGGASSSSTTVIPLPASNTGVRNRIEISNMTFRQLSEKLKELEVVAKSALPANASAQERQRYEDEMKKQRTPILVNLHRQLAFSFACIGFTLIGIPLGIRTHRRETSIGIAIALLLVLVYFSFLILGEAWQIYPDRYPYLLMWLPNFLFQAVGGILLWKANQRG